MAVAASAFNWARASSGVWTRIAMGPLVSGLPFQALELATMGGTASISFTLDGYSASPPFYERDVGTVRTSFSGSPPLGSTGNWAVVLSYRLSPWAEFWLLPNRPCFAHIAQF
jgi:hypothetical protein